MYRVIEIDVLQQRFIMLNKILDNDLKETMCIHHTSSLIGNQLYLQRRVNTILHLSGTVLVLIV